MLPPIILKSGLMEGMPGVQLLESYNIDDTLYFKLVFILLFCFLAGGGIPLLFVKKTKVQKGTLSTIINAKNLFFISLPLFIYGQSVIFKARNILFKGYLVEYDLDTLGPITTLNSIFIFCYLLCIQKDDRFKAYSKFFLFSIIEFSVILLGLGSRMYVLIPLIIFALYFWDTNKIKPVKIIYVIFGILLMLSIGIIRQGQTINLLSIFYIGAAEPLFTWISAISYLQYNPIQLFNIPYNFISSFINFIPSIILPNKGEFIYNIAQVYDAPLGAMSILTSLLDNFGFLGSCFFLFFGSCILTIIRYNWNTTIGKTFYLCVCGIIPFQIFRDPFTVVNKMIFFNFLIWPIFLFLVIKLLISNRSIRNK